MSDSIPANSAPEFALAMRGYDRMQVETYVDRLRDQLEECTLRLHRTEERAAATARDRNLRIAELEDQVAALERRRLDQTAPTFSALGVRIAQMLDLAAAEGAAMKERAAHEAEAIVEDARRRGQEIERERLAGQDRLQRQLYDLRDTVMSLLGGAGDRSVSGARPDAGPRGEGTSTQEMSALADEVAQAVERLPAEGEGGEALVDERVAG